MRESIQGFIRDPVCGITVNPNSTNLISAYNGQDYYFCAESCREAFEEDPERYLKKKGFFAKFLGRLTEANRKTFGPRGPSCCN